MNDTALKNFATWARTTLMDGVRSRMAYYLVDDGTDADAAATVDGTLLSEQQRRQRADLLRIVREGGADALVERAAYTWFNRIAAIRFMELNDRLPCGMRLLSTKDRAFDRRTQAVEEALVIEIEGLDRQKVLEAIQSSDDERLFRVLFLAQCAELSACMPAVFEPIGSAMELLLPVNLLAQDSLIQHLVEDIPEDDWREGVEIVGWLYQYYNADVKRQLFDDFKKGKKAEAKDIPIATQLFTPEWIVRYFVENSLGRLWMLNNPDSKLAESMQYFIAPDEESDFRTIASPEEIQVCDPACGSSHVLAYAFELLVKMYEESGYPRRDIPRLILKKNLTGFEIDLRAAQLACFELTMKAYEVDPRFLRRAVQPQIVLLEKVCFENDELGQCPSLAKRTDLIDAIAHLDECGSLFSPVEDDLLALETALSAIKLAANGNLFAAALESKLEAALSFCRELSSHYDVIAANPPYMGGKNMNKWLSAWVKKTYPEVKGDLFSCFIERCMQMGVEGAQIGMMTPYVWMFIGTYEKLRTKLVDECTITSLVQLEYSGFGGATVPICTFTFENRHIAGYKGGYVRLSDFVGADNQAPKTLEAIANPDCGWFYRRCADDFKDIPGTPIAYWASEAVRHAFRCGERISSLASTKCGLSAGTNDLFLRKWWEVDRSKESFCSDSKKSARESGCRWFACNKGGPYRKWAGNNEDVIDWEDDGFRIRNHKDDYGQLISRPLNTETFFSSCLTWSAISSGCISFRYRSVGYVYEHAGANLFGEEEVLAYIQGACNSSSMLSIANILSPTLNYQVGQISSYPVIRDQTLASDITRFVADCRSVSAVDWDSHEISWDFKRHPLVEYPEIA